MNDRYVWAEFGDHAEILSADELACASENPDGIGPAAVGIRIQAGADEAIVYGNDRATVIAWAEDLAARLRAGEAAPSTPDGGDAMFVLPAPPAPRPFNVPAFPPALPAGLGAIMADTPGYPGSAPYEGEWEPLHPIRRNMRVRRTEAGPDSLIYLVGPVVGDWAMILPEVPARLGLAGPADLRWYPAAGLNAAG